MRNKITKPVDFNFQLIYLAVFRAFIKFLPQHQIRNPIMFTVYIGSILISALYVQSVMIGSENNSLFILAICLSLWFTLLCANFAESMAEGRGMAQARTLKKNRHEMLAKKLNSPSKDAKQTLVNAWELKCGDIVLVEESDLIPSDGTVISGIASVNESAITGESAPVIRESGGDRSAVTGGTLVLSDWLIIKITSNPGETFLDKMISLVEGAKRVKTPNEISLTILLAAMTIIFLVVSATLLPFALYGVSGDARGSVISITILTALFVCLAPTTIGGLLSAIGIAGIDRMIQANVIAMSGHAIEAAGDVDVLLLDKTGTITLGDRKAINFIPADRVGLEELVDAAQMSSLADETPEGRSIVVLAKEKYGFRSRDMTTLQATFIPYTAQTRMSGANLPGRQIRKGAAAVIEKYIKEQGGYLPDNVRENINLISKKGGTALVVAENKKILGVVHLKDVIKGGIKERFAKLRKMGIKTIMVTGDNPLTAASIAAEAGVDDFFANATPEDKLKLIKLLQDQGNLVAMAGDGTNDAPALAQSNVALAMNTGTQEAKEAGNLIDLDSNPTKLIEIVEIGKQLLITRGSLTTFSISSDIAKYFAILPAAFITTYPALNSLNIMSLATPKSAILSTVIFNALNIIFLIPIALSGVKYKHVGASQLLKNNLITYALGGLLLPFVGIKALDLIISRII
ncbi:MAG: potassium-transporting ATPase subunit KdpB [Legionellaceae bacterium]|nr:potassium-transporting ATPase subunit KdpB [Legionellaceae bacterium]